MDFHKVGSSYVNLSRVDSISVQSEDHVTLHAYGDSNIAVSGDDARAILAKLRGEPSDEVEVREKSGTGYTLPTSTLTEAQNQAQELAKTLGSSQGRTFDFQDSTGQNRRGTVSKIYGGWVAEVDGQRFEGTSEAAAMAAVMSGVA